MSPFPRHMSTCQAHRSFLHSSLMDGWMNGREGGSQLEAQRHESWACCKERMAGGDQVQCTKHRSKPTGEGQGLSICHFGRRIRDSLARGGFM